MDRETFLDIRSHGFARLAVVIPRVHVANPHANAQEHINELKKVFDNGAHYALCPELGLTGYTCGDLFHSEGLINTATEALSELLKATASWPMLISVGAPLVLGTSLFNCAITAYQGRIIGIVPKSYLPEYREFYEMRHFAPAINLPFKNAKIAGQEEEIPIGTDLLFRHSSISGFILHTDICEDIWVPIPPGTQAALAGATILANLSASNITVGKSEYRTDLVVASSGRNNAVQMYSAAGYGESTTDHAWDGQGIIAERGTLLKMSERFSLNGTSIIQDVDLSSLTLERMRQGSFRMNVLDHPKEFRIINFGASDEQRRSKYFRFERSVDPHPFVPKDEAKRDERCYEVFKIQATSLARRLEALPPESRRIFIGISGGQDSTHALLVAVHALDMLKIPREYIYAITMPGFGTTGRTYNNACALARALKVSFREMPVKTVSEEMFKGIGFNPETENLLPFENIQAWMRTQTLFATACHKGGIVLGTGDLSELMLGWCTYGGDHLSHYGINAGVPKTLISFLIRWTSRVVFKNEPAVQAILNDIVDTPISPELLPAKDGAIVQKTEEKIGPYELHDFFGYWFVRFGFEPTRIARMCLAAFGGKYTISEIKKWLRLFFVRFFANQFKRSCIPDGPKVGLTCLSPRGDWRMPSDVKPDIWLADIEKIPENLE